MIRIAVMACAVVTLSIPAWTRAQSLTIGYVDDIDSRTPIVGASVRIVAAGAPSTGPTAVVLASTRTRPDGTFDLPSDIRGVLEIAAAGYATSRVLWPTSGQPVASLERAATIVIEVSDENGAPMKAIASAMTFHPGNVVMDSVRAPFGVAEFRNVPSGPTTLTVRAEQMAPTAFAMDIRSGLVHRTAVALQRAAVVRGRILDSTGTRRQNVKVVARYSRDVPFGDSLASFLSRRSSGTADFDFEIRNVIPGATLHLYAEDRGQRSPVTSVVLAAGETREDISLTIQ